MGKATKILNHYPRRVRTRGESRDFEGKVIVVKSL